MKLNKIWGVILFSLIARLIFFNANYPNLWDDAVYIAVGKYILSGGLSGFFEPIRPLVLSSILGIFWKLNLNILIFGKIFQIIISLSSIYVLYLIAKKIYNENTALIAALLFSFTPTFFFLSFSLIPGLLATFFLLIAFYFLLNKNNIFLTGIFLSLSFLTKFYYGLFLIVIGFYVFSKKISIEKIKNPLILGAGFTIPLIPYFIINHIMHKNILFPFIEAQRVIGKVVACNIINPQPWYYFFTRVFIENFLLIFFIIGAYFVIKEGKKEKWLLLFATIIPFIYLSMQNCKTPRYLLFFLPFIAVIAGVEINKIIKNKKILTIILFLVIFSLPLIYHSNNLGEFQGNYEEYVLPNGTILSNTPVVSVNNDNKVIPSYYPLHTTEKMIALMGDVENKEFDLVLVDSCSGDLFCHPDDMGCEDSTKEFLKIVKENYRLDYIEDRGYCNITLFHK